MATSESDAAQQFAASQLQNCLSPKLVRAKKQHNLPIAGALTFVDEGTDEGWGPGCKFEGSFPKHQVVIDVFKR